MTKNFTFKELTRSMTATRMGFNEQFDPSQEAIDNLNLLTKNILQPLRDAVKHNIYVQSGYRCLRLNTHIGGAKNSQHCLGQAADIDDEYDNKTLFNKIIELKLPFDQLINEFNYAWIHVSYSDKNRRQKLKAYKLNGLTIYKTI